MGGLVFQRPMHARAPLPYGLWLREIADSILLLSLGADTRAPDVAYFQHVDSFDSLEVAKAIERLREHCDVTHVFAQSEHDVIRAAELRERLGARGQSLASAVAYRDKLTMKDRARAAGVETPAFARADTASEVRAFVAHHGLPCVLKPRLGAGSRGVRVLRAARDVDAVLASGLAEGSMIEHWVDATVHHVDGLFIEGAMTFACASRYIRTCLSFQTGESMGSAILDPASALSKRLVAFTERVLRALPAAPVVAFHAEVFASADDPILLCEVACRPGGSRTVEAIEVAFGIDLYRHWVRASFGLPTVLEQQPQRSSAGRLIVPPRPGRLLSLPASTPFDWVADYRPNAKVGHTYVGQPASSGDNVASFVVRGRDDQEVESRLLTLDEWFRRNHDWSEAP